MARRRKTCFLQIIFCCASQDSLLHTSQLWYQISWWWITSPLVSKDVIKHFISQHSVCCCNKNIFNYFTVASPGVSVIFSCMFTLSVSVHTSLSPVTVSESSKLLILFWSLLVSQCRISLNSETNDDNLMFWYWWWDHRIRDMNVSSVCCYLPVMYGCSEWCWVVVGWFSVVYVYHSLSKQCWQQNIIWNLKLKYNATVLFVSE